MRMADHGAGRGFDVSGLGWPDGFAVIHSIRDVAGQVPACHAVAAAVGIDGDSQRVRHALQPTRSRVA